MIIDMAGKLYGEITAIKQDGRSSSRPGIKKSTIYMRLNKYNWPQDKAVGRVVL